MCECIVCLYGYVCCIFVCVCVVCLCVYVSFMFMCVESVYVCISHVFSLDNSAEKLFELMDDKDSISYDALILGLFKV